MLRDRGIAKGKSGEAPKGRVKLLLASLSRQSQTTEAELFGESRGSRSLHLCRKKLLVGGW